MSTGLSSLKASEDALNQGNLSTTSTATSRTIGCPICSSLVGANIAKNHSLSWNNSEKKCIVCGKNCGKPALLDLFSGAGGAARGYQRAGFCVLGVDIKPQPHYAGCRFVQADAMTYPLEGFDAIHASPPCQHYSTCTPMRYRGNHPDLITAVRIRLSGRIYIIENVPGARKKLIRPIILCGSMFGLPIRRHRCFEVNPELAVLLPGCHHKKDPVYISGSTGSGSSPEGFKRFDFTTQERRDAMDCQWMTDKEIDQAIPPAYTEWIGRQLMEVLP